MFDEEISGEVLEDLGAFDIEDMGMWDEHEFFDDIEAQLVANDHMRGKLIR